MIRRAVVLAALMGCCLSPAWTQKSPKERIAAFAKLPDWSGIWQLDMWADELDGQQFGPEGLKRARVYAAELHPSYAPAWQPKADELRAKQAAANAPSPNPPGRGVPSDCNFVPGFPAITQPGYYEWQVTPEEATLITSLGAVRHIYTGGRSHPPKDELWPTKQGDSVGHWDGDTLVIDTVAIKPPVTLGFGQVAGPFSDQLHAVERIRMINPDELEIHFTWDDPVALAAPIDMTIDWVRVKDLNRMEENEQECDPAEDRNPVVNGRFTTIIKPPSATPAAPSK
ncbi:MAG: hypothetical protein KGL75_07125 [Acidobacteriota bacterium]|nr:hypothetical protein [Acidobacteriota bacterium]